MKVITHKDIQELNITPKQCVEWVTDSFRMKPQCQLPAKVHVHPQGKDFITTMPCLLPAEYHKFGVKVVSRINGRKPALRSDIMLFDSITGQLEAVVDADWITSMRTGAVASLAIDTFGKTDAKLHAIIGLGSTAHATVSCLLNAHPERAYHFRLFRYKDQAERFAQEFAPYANAKFEIVNSSEALVADADVVLSCITDAEGLIVENVDCFKPGVVVVPVHTRGFQNCDTVFDKVFADDTAHVQGFKYFNQFRQFAEFSDVLLGKVAGRENDEERILSYNIGIGLHDVLFAHRIVQQITTATK